MNSVNKLLHELNIPLDTKIRFLILVKKHTGIAPVKKAGNIATFTDEEWCILLKEGKKLYNLHQTPTVQRNRSQVAINRERGLPTRLTPHGGLL